MFQDRCEECGGIIPAAFNNGEIFQRCPKCLEKLRTENRDIPKGQTLLSVENTSGCDR